MSPSPTDPSPPEIPDGPVESHSGIAVLQDETEFDPSSPPWPVHGVAMTPGVTHGGSGLARYWPAAVLEEAAESGLLTDKPIVKNYHELEGQATADDVIGKVTATTWDEDLGFLYQGEISDVDIAQKIANGYLDVSVVAMLEGESYDPDRDVYVVEGIEAFRDIAVVATGAMRENEIAIGTNPALSALSAEALSRAFPMEPTEPTEATEQGPPTPTEPAADPAAPDSPVTGTEDGRGKDTPPEPDAASEPASTPSEAVGAGDDDAGDLPDGSGAATLTRSPLTRALRAALDITDPASPLVGKRSVKEDAHRIDVGESKMAREVLGLPEPDDPRADPIDLETDGVARAALGLDEDEEEETGPAPWRPASKPIPKPGDTLTGTTEVPETYDPNEDPLTAAALRGGATPEEEADEGPAPWRPASKSIPNPGDALTDTPEEPETYDPDADPLTAAALRGGATPDEEADADDAPGSTPWRQGRSLPGRDVEARKSFDPVPRTPGVADLDDDGVARGALGLKPPADADGGDPDPGPDPVTDAEPAVDADDE